MQFNRINFRNVTVQRVLSRFQLPVATTSSTLQRRPRTRIESYSPTWRPATCPQMCIHRTDRRSDAKGTSTGYLISEQIHSGPKFALTNLVLALFFPRLPRLLIVCSFFPFVLLILFPRPFERAIIVLTRKRATRECSRRRYDPFQENRTRDALELNDRPMSSPRSRVRSDNGGSLKFFPSREESDRRNGTPEETLSLSDMSYVDRVRVSKDAESVHLTIRTVL